jgi:hypothetical protein
LVKREAGLCKRGKGPVNCKEILGLVSSSLESFRERDGKLIKLGASERAITHKLAEHLQQQIGSAWDVDCEYNRIERQKKVIHASKAKIAEFVSQGIAPEAIRLDMVVALEPDEKPLSVYPDIIVHERGEPRNNLLIIEVKKRNTKILGDWDKWKLRFYVEELGYRMGVFIVLDADDEVSCTWELEPFPSEPDCG